jgi:uncharacterized protein
VYCIEWPEVPDGKVLNLFLPDDAPLSTEYRSDLLGGVQVVTGEAQRAQQSDQTPAAVAFTAIPYYAWAHRGKGEMAVWLPRTPDMLGTDSQPKSENAKP